MIMKSIVDQYVIHFFMPYSRVLSTNYQRIVKLPKVTSITLLTYYKISLTNTWVSYHCGLESCWEIFLAMCPYYNILLKHDYSLICIE